MDTENLTLRPANGRDSRTIAELYQMAAGGVADYIWQDLAEDGESILDAGARRFAREGESVSFENCTMAEAAGEVAGMIHTYGVGELDPVPDDMDPVLLPYCELEEPHSLYIMGIACRPEFRGRGIGTRLMARAEQHARNLGLGSLSLIAFEENTGSVRLYERLGFTTTARRAIVPHELIKYGGDALLMVAPVDT